MKENKGKFGKSIMAKKLVNQVDKLFNRVGSALGWVTPLDTVLVVGHALWDGFLGS